MRHTLRPHRRTHVPFPYRRPLVRSRGASLICREPITSDVMAMHATLRLARKAAGIGEVPVGAIVVHQGRIIGRGYNRREHDHDPTAHAEIIAMRQAAETLGQWRLNDCTLYVTLEPCPMCAGAMVNARLGRLVWGAADPKMGAVRTLYQLCSDPRLNHRIQTARGVLARDCGHILSRFFALRRRGHPPR